MEKFTIRQHYRNDLDCDFVFEQNRKLNEKH